MNGFDVCQALRADPELSATRILMLTAKGVTRKSARVSDLVPMAT
jgi:DNA-binding response OmpR family regulator